jgi:hypothetical protein
MATECALVGMSASVVVRAAAVPSFTGLASFVVPSFTVLLVTPDFARPSFAAASTLSFSPALIAIKAALAVFRVAIAASTSALALATAMVALAPPPSTDVTPDAVSKFETSRET